MLRRLIAATLAAVLICPLPHAASAAARPARAARTLQPGPAWLQALGQALPELGLEAGLDAAGPRINDYGDSGIRAARGALQRAARAPRGATPDAAVLRARLARESMKWNELDFLSRRPGAFLPTEAMLAALNVESVPFTRRLEWLAARLEQAPLRLGMALSHPFVASRELAQGGLTDVGAAATTLERIERHADTLGLAPALRAQLKDNVVSTRGMVARFEDFLKNDVLPRSRADSRADTAVFARLLREGYAIGEPPAAIEARLRDEAAATRRELDSLTATLDSTQSTPRMLQVLQGSHPTAAGLIPSLTAVFRHMERVGQRRWPGLPAAPLEIDALDFGYRIQGQTSAYRRPRPLRAALEEPAFGVVPVDPFADANIQEGALRQLNVYYDSVLAMRQDMPGETMLWRLHMLDPGERLWAAGLHTFQAWGMFGQRLGVRAGCVMSAESRLFESWSRLTMLARALVDVRLGRRAVEPSVATAEVSRATSIDPVQCRGYVREALENPGRQAAIAWRALDYERSFDALRARGLGEAAALRKLAETALFNPSDQARLLGLPPSPDRRLP
jgi:hypothetical protein